MAIDHPGELPNETFLRRKNGYFPEQDSNFCFQPPFYTDGSSLTRVKKVVLILPWPNQKTGISMLHTD